MKISIGINGFKDFSSLEKRERFCIDGLLKLKNKNTNIELYNVCFNNENIRYDNFTTLSKLKIRSNKLIYDYFQHDGLKNEYELRKSEIDNNNKELPSVKEIFDVLASTDCDYFLFLNNDIILSNRLLKEIEDGIECYPISRMHIDDIDSLDQTPILESYSVHGFDAFLVKKDTWLQVRNNFEDFILGRFYWDTYFFTMFNLLCKCKNINKLPPVCFHIEHNSTSMENSIENYYAEDVFKRNVLVNQLWFSYVQNILLKRPTINNCKWYQPFSNEAEIEQRHFNPFSKTTLSINKNFIACENITNDGYDIFIPVALKDEYKLPHLIESIYEYQTFNKIYIVSPDKINSFKDSKINYFLDRDLLPNVKKENFSFRPGWMYQQMLKLFQNVTEKDYYLVLDSDAVLLKPLTIFNENHPIWYYGWRQNHLPYFLYLKKIFNISKSLNHTGIGDIGIFNKKIINSFLKYCNCKTPQEFISNIQSNMNLLFHFSEYETYSNFTKTYYPDLYQYSNIKQFNTGRDSNIGQYWTDQEINSTIKEAKQTDANLLLMHTWN